MRIPRTTRRSAGTFLREQHGVAAIEFAIIAPVIALLLLGCVTLFALFRGSEVAEKATFTVGDIVSRETEVTNSSLDKFHSLFLSMLPNRRAETGFRISSLKKDAGKISIDWSYAVPPMKKLTTADIPTRTLPLIADKDSLVFVETHVAYAPIFRLAGVSAGTYESVAINRPRFTAAIKGPN